MKATEKLEAHHMPIMEEMKYKSQEVIQYSIFYNIFQAGGTKFIFVKQKRRTVNWIVRIFPFWTFSQLVFLG